MWEMYLREAENQHDDKYSAVIFCWVTQKMTPATLAFME